MGHSESCFLSEKKSRLPHLSRLPLRYLQTVAFSLTCRGSEHRGPPACGSGGCDTKLSFIHQLYFSIQKEELLLKWKAKVLFLLFFSRHRYTHTHTQRVAGNPEQQLEFLLEHIKARIEEAADHDSKWSRLSRKTNILDISKAVPNSAQSLFAPCASVLLCQNIKLPPALTKLRKLYQNPNFQFKAFSFSPELSLVMKSRKHPPKSAVL